MIFHPFIRSHTSHAHTPIYHTPTPLMLTNLYNYHAHTPLMLTHLYIMLTHLYIMLTHLYIMLTHLSCLHISHVHTFTHALAYKSQSHYYILYQFSQCLPPIIIHLAQIGRRKQYGTGLSTSRQKIEASVQ